MTVLEDRITPLQRALLLANCSFPRHTATATELARAVGKTRFQLANAVYGKLGSLLREEVHAEMPGQRSAVIALFKRRDELRGGEWDWKMRPALVRALKELGWLTKPTQRGQRLKPNT